MPLESDDLGLLLQHEHDRTARRHHRERQVGRVEDEGASHDGQSTGGLAAREGLDAVNHNACNLPRRGGRAERDAWSCEQGPRGASADFGSAAALTALRPPLAAPPTGCGNLPPLDRIVEPARDADAAAFARQSRTMSGLPRGHAVRVGGAGGGRRAPQDWTRFAARFHQIETQRRARGPGQARGDPARARRADRRGHLLIEDVPGVGKTMLAKAIARSIDCSFRRIQFTPDLLPTDVTGVNVFNQEQRDFEFKPGAIFANIVLGDEINRATPEDPVGPARMHGGAAGHGRHRDPPARHAVHGDRHAEPDRARGHLPAARGPARPVHAAAVDRLPERRDRDRDPRQPHGRRAAARRDRAGERRAAAWPR